MIWLTMFFSGMSTSIVKYSISFSAKAFVKTGLRIVGPSPSLVGLSLAMRTDAF